MLGEMLWNIKCILQAWYDSSKWQDEHFDAEAGIRRSLHLD